MPQTKLLFKVDVCVCIKITPEDFDVSSQNLSDLFIW